MNEEMLVSDETCKGCRHYGFFAIGVPCCNFCYDTGMTRPEGQTPAECTVKVLGERKSYFTRAIRFDEM